LSCFTILSPVQNKWKSTSAKIVVSFLFATPFLENIAITFCRSCCIIRLFVLLCTRRWVATMFKVVQGAKQVFFVVTWSNATWPSMTFLKKLGHLECCFLLQQLVWWQHLPATRKYC
jgi:hypothetical protein